MPTLNPFVIGVRVARPELHERIRARLDQRLESGMVEEVRRLMESGVSAARLEQIGLEYRHVGRFVRGEVGYEPMREELFRAICRFAKRQDTWFRGMERRGTPICWIDGCDIAGALAAVDSAIPPG
jgi:tRNA dimethylallyltransferase